MPWDPSTDYRYLKLVVSAHGCSLTQPRWFKCTHATHTCFWGKARKLEVKASLVWNPVAKPYLKCWNPLKRTLTSSIYSKSSIRGPSLCREIDLTNLGCLRVKINSWSTQTYTSGQLSKLIDVLPVLSMASTMLPMANNEARWGSVAICLHGDATYERRCQGDNGDEATR